VEKLVEWSVTKL